MTVEFAAQTIPILWVLIATLALMALIVVACIEPELAEVYLGDWQLFIAAVALAALLFVIGSEHADAAHELALVKDFPSCGHVAVGRGAQCAGHARSAADAPTVRRWGRSNHLIPARLALPARTSPTAKILGRQ